MSNYVSNIVCSFEGEEEYFGECKDVEKLIEGCLKSVGLREYVKRDEVFDENGVLESVNLCYVDDEKGVVYDMEKGGEWVDCYGEYVFNFMISKE